MPLERFQDAAGGKIPELDAPDKAGRGEELAVGTERDADRVIVADGSEPPAVRTEGHIPDPLGVSLERAQVVVAEAVPAVPLEAAQVRGLLCRAMAVQKLAQPVELIRLPELREEAEIGEVAIALGEALGVTKLLSLLPLRLGTH